jgi:DNA-binding CsgD family transcriptional regulator
VSSAARVDPAILPLLEREASLERLREALTDVRGGEGRTVLVQGEAGVGKTALVHRFCQESGDRARVLVGACDPLFTPRPLGPFADVADAIGGELGALVETGAIPYRIAAALVEEMDAHGPTILVIEDVHWADEATLDVLRLLARRIADVPVLLIATYRDDELDARHPLRIVLGGLTSIRTIRRLPLAPLSFDAVTRLAEPYGADPDELFRMTSGNPFFVTEVLAGNPEKIPETVRDAVRARIAGLGSAATAVLEAVSTVPAGAEPWLLEALVGSLAGGLGECLDSGILTAGAATIVFRHELARLAVEESLAVDRRIVLNRRALAALSEQPAGRRDLARLAHHADAAGDVAAVLEFAPAAAAQASSLGAHREAAAQYRRALRYAQGLPLEQRAGLLGRYSHECYLTDETDEAIDSLWEAVGCYRKAGDRLQEGATLGRIADILWCPGRGEEAKKVGLEAVDLLEKPPRGPELAMAYNNMAGLHRLSAELDACREWSDRALVLAEGLGEEGTLAYVSGGATLLDIMAGSPEALADFEQRIRARVLAGREDDAAHMIEGLVMALVFRNPYTRARRYIDDGLRYARSQGLELAHLYLLAYRSRLELDEGRFDAAAETAELVLGEHFVSTFPRTLALVTLALVRTRRGDPDVWPVLDEALALSDPTGELPRIAPVAMARGEAAWLARRPEAVARETEAAFELALKRRAPWASGELATLRWRAGIEERRPDELPEPHRLQLSGDWRGAASAWKSLGCPYETALALFDGGDPEGLREALDICTWLGARPLATMVSRRLRELGASVPRGPRPSTRENPAGLTSRESEILELLAEGLRNAEIADRLVLSRRTVDHHVSAILRKLDVRTRGEAAAAASRLGLLEDR